MSIKPEQKSYVLMRCSKGEEWVLESNNEAVSLMGQVFFSAQVGALEH